MQEAILKKDEAEKLKEEKTTRVESYEAQVLRVQRENKAALEKIRLQQEKSDAIEEATRIEN